MKNEKISLDKLKEMKEVLENKNTLLMNPIMPTILGYSIKEIIDEFIKEKTKYDMPIELINMFKPPVLTAMEKELKIEQEKRERERGKRKAEMIDEVTEYFYPRNKIRNWNERSDYRRHLKELSPETFKDFIINFYIQRLDEKAAEREEIIKKMKKSSDEKMPAVNDLP